MLIKIGEFDCTECWDGVFYKKLAYYPVITEWEIQTVLDFENYEKQNGRDCFIEADHSILKAIEEYKKTYESGKRVNVPEKITECVAYISHDPLLSDSSNIASLSLQVSENTREISEIKETMVTKDDLTKVIQSFSLPDKGIEYVIYAGQTFEADAAYADIYIRAKKKLYIVDNYIGPKTLLMLKSVPANVDIIIFSDNLMNILRLSELQAFQTEYPNVKLSFQRTGGKFHDRYIIIDYKCRTEKIYHCGASSKDAGNKITTISKSDNRSLYYPMVDNLLLQPTLKLR